jgi:hypothetical protein
METVNRLGLLGEGSRTMGVLPQHWNVTGTTAAGLTLPWRPGTTQTPFSLRNSTYGPSGIPYSQLWLSFGLRARSRTGRSYASGVAPTI